MYSCYWFLKWVKSFNLPLLDEEGDEESDEEFAKSLETSEEKGGNHTSYIPKKKFKLGLNKLGSAM